MMQKMSWNYVVYLVLLHLLQFTRFCKVCVRFASNFLNAYARRKLCESQSTLLSIYLKHTLINR